MAEALAVPNCGTQFMPRIGTEVLVDFIGNGPVSLEAHTNQLEILGEKAITVIAVNDCIEIKAKEKIVLLSAQSLITLARGNFTFACPGKFTFKGGQHLFDGVCGDEQCR